LVSSNTVYTPEKELIILEQLSLTGNVTVACRKAKVSRESFYAHCRADPDLLARKEAARNAGIRNRVEDAEDELFNLVRQGNVTAVIFTLKSHKREVYGDRTVNEHTGKDGAPLKVVIERVTGSS
jgi:hypothetical protein